MILFNADLAAVQGIDAGHVPAMPADAAPLVSKSPSSEDIFCFQRNFQQLSQSPSFLNTTDRPHAIGLQASAQSTWQTAGSIPYPVPDSQTSYVTAQMSLPELPQIPENSLAANSASATHVSQTADVHANQASTAPQTTANATTQHPAFRFTGIVASNLHPQPWRSTVAISDNSHASAVPGIAFSDNHAPLSKATYEQSISAPISHTEVRTASQMTGAEQAAPFTKIMQQTHEILNSYMQSSANPVISTEQCMPGKIGEMPMESLGSAENIEPNKATMTTTQLPTTEAFIRQQGDTTWPANSVTQPRMTDMTLSPNKTVSTAKQAPTLTQTQDNATTPQTDSITLQKQTGTVTPQTGSTPQPQADSMTSQKQTGSTPQPQADSMTSQKQTGLTPQPQADSMTSQKQTGSMPQPQADSMASQKQTGSMPQPQTGSMASSVQTASPQAPQQGKTPDPAGQAKPSSGFQAVLHQAPGNEPPAIHLNVQNNGLTENSAVASLPNQPATSADTQPAPRGETSPQGLSQTASPAQTAVPHLPTMAQPHELIPSMPQQPPKAEDTQLNELANNNPLASLNKTALELADRGSLHAELSVEHRSSLPKPNEAGPNVDESPDSKRHTPAEHPQSLPSAMQASPMAVDSSMPSAPMAPVAMMPEIAAVTQLAMPAVEILTQTVNELADTLMTRFDAQTGIGEIKLILKPDVLQGTEIRLIGDAQQVHITFFTYDATITSLLASNQTYLAETVAAKASVNVKVSVIDVPNRKRTHSVA